MKKTLTFLLLMTVLILTASVISACDSRELHIPITGKYINEANPQDCWLFGKNGELSDSAGLIGKYKTNGKKLILELFLFDTYVEKEFIFADDKKSFSDDEKTYVLYSNGGEKDFILNGTYSFKNMEYYSFYENNRVYVTNNNEKFDGTYEIEGDLITITKNESNPPGNKIGPYYFEIKVDSIIIDLREYVRK